MIFSRTPLNLVATGLSLFLKCSLTGRPFFFLNSTRTSSYRWFGTTYRLPLPLIEFKFVRSSGPGGQHVNKVSTACEARVEIKKLDLPDAVLARLLEQQKNRINNKMELVVDSQEERSQHRNRERCVEKLQYIVDTAFVEPKTRIVQIEPPDKTKEKWREEKRHRKDLKESRKKIKDFDKYM